MTDTETPQDHESVSDSPEPSKPFIRVSFAGELSANITLEMDKVSAAMLWAAAAMLHQYANDVWEQNRMERMQEDLLAQQAAQRSGLVPVRGMLQDHREARRTRN